MTRPLPLSAFPRVAPALTARLVDGLASAIDPVAAAAADSHRFLTHGWFAAAVAAYGGHPRTVVVEEGALVGEAGVPVLALPLVGMGPAPLKLASVPGSYWPFRSFPIAANAAPATAPVALATLARHVNGVRIGPVHDGDPGASTLIKAARGMGWAAIDRVVARSWLLDMAALGDEWPRGSTLRKNRFHEKHLAARGALDWRFLTGEDWASAETGAFDALAEIERASWIAARTDGRDAKFTWRGHGAFWRAAAADPVVAGMMRAALLTVDGRPAAFSFDLDAGALRYAVANSYDPAIGKHSPGKLLQYRNLVDARARGIERVDWGAGDSGYKQVIGAEAGPAIRDWLLLRPGMPAAMGRMLRGMWRRSGKAAADA